MQEAPSKPTKEDRVRQASRRTVEVMQEKTRATTVVGRGKLPPNRGVVSLGTTEIK